MKIQVKSDTNFNVESIRITEQKPKRGDIHPLSKQDIKSIISKIPTKYVYKLKAIELLERNSKPGNPWGEYRPSDAKIVLYSHPLKIADGSDVALEMAFASNRSMTLLADLIEEDGVSYSVWTEEMLKLFYFEVLTHEIGHHYYRVTRFQKKMPVGRYHETLAENYKDRILAIINTSSDFFTDKSEKNTFQYKLNEFLDKKFPEDNT